MAFVLVSRVCVGATDAGDMAEVLQLNGVIRFVSMGREGVTIPESPTERIRAPVSKLFFPRGRAWQRLRIRGFHCQRILVVASDDTAEFDSNFGGCLRTTLNTP